MTTKPQRRYPQTWLNAWGKRVNPQCILLCRVALGWNQTELGDYIGVSQRTVSCWENNIQWPDPVNAARLAIWIEATKKRVRTGQLKPPKAFYSILDNS